MRVARYLPKADYSRFFDSATLPSHPRNALVSAGDFFVSCVSREGVEGLGPLEIAWTATREWQRGHMVDGILCPHEGGVILRWISRGEASCVRIIVEHFGLKLYLETLHFKVALLSYPKPMLRAARLREDTR
jgi:hypothetical protein